jgi:hypothetical protein
LRVGDRDPNLQLQISFVRLSRLVEQSTGGSFRWSWRISPSGHLCLGAGATHGLFDTGVDLMLRNEVGPEWQRTPAVSRPCLSQNALVIATQTRD